MFTFKKDLKPPNRLLETSLLSTLECGMSKDWI